MVSTLENKKPKNTAFTRLLRALIEVGFIIFLFYSNLLMGEYTNTKNVPGKSLITAIQNIFTVTNFTIAFISGLLGYLVFEFLRKKL